MFKQKNLNINNMNESDHSRKKKKRREEIREGRSRRKDTPTNTNGGGSNGNGGENISRSSPRPPQASQPSRAVSSVRYQSLDDLDADDKEIFDILANPKKRHSHVNEVENGGNGGGGGVTSVRGSSGSGEREKRSSPPPMTMRSERNPIAVNDNRTQKSNSPLVSPRETSPNSPHSPSAKDFPQHMNFEPTSNQQWASNNDEQILNEMSPEEETKRKQELLEGFDKLARKGVRIHRMFDMTSSLDEMESEYQRLVRQRELEQSIRFQRRLLLTFVTGVEMFNKKYDPFDVELDGWSEVVYAEIDSYDDIFEELYEKYHTKVKMAPELRLLFALGGSAVMFHISNTMMQQTMPGMGGQMNPEMMQNIASRMQSMGKQGGIAPQMPPNMGMGGMGGNMGMGGGNMGNMGMGGNMGGMRAPPTVSNMNGEQPKMRGPSNMMFGSGAMPEEMDGIGMNMNANKQQTRNERDARVFNPSQPGKSRPQTNDRDRGRSDRNKGRSGQSNELKEILTGLQLDDREAHAIATDLEDVMNSESDGHDNDTVRQVRVNNKDTSIRLE